MHINTLIESRSTILYDLCNFYSIQCITPKRIYDLIGELTTYLQTILLPSSNCLRAIKNFITGRNMIKAVIDDDDDNDQDRFEQNGEHFNK